MKKRKTPFISIVLALLLFMAQLVPLASPALAGGDGLQNPGFENGLAGWEVIGPIADGVSVVGTEGPAEFPTYLDMGGVTISPIIGDFMLRLGGPKGLNEKQNRGDNRVSQTFTSNHSTLQFAFRLFSWEHRGYDTFSFDLTNADDTAIPGATVTKIDGSPLELTMPDGTTLIDSTLPVNFTLDVGKRGQYLAPTEWTKVIISGVPTGKRLTLTYNLAGTNNEAHPTWVYIDNVNTPPVADFELSPITVTEGGVVDFTDKSYDPDPGDQVTAWEWNIAWGEIAPDGTYAETAISNQRNPYFVPPDEGDYVVTLIVTDSFGATGTKSVVMGVANVPPIVNALNIEVLPDETANLMGRFLDSGWRDTHTAVWSLDGLSPAATLQEDNLAFMDSGIVIGEVTTSVPLVNGTLTVSDDANPAASASDNFDVIVIIDDPNRHEANNTVSEAFPLTGDTVYLSYIQSAGDIDVFEIVTPDGVLPSGSEVLATLKGLPADYDLLILTQRPEGPDPGGWGLGGWGLGGWGLGGWGLGGWGLGGWGLGGWGLGGWGLGGWGLGGWGLGGWGLGTFEQYPLSRMGFNGLEVLNDNIGGSDISLGELGLSLEELAGTATNLTVAGFSANRGLADETLLASTDVSGMRIFVVVVGANDAHSTQPYSLQIETSSPVDIATWLASQNIVYEPPVDAWPGDPETDVPTVLHSYTGTAKTLFVTQQERFIGRYGQQDWDDLESSLTTLAAHPAIAGDIISVPISIYQQWDSDYSSIDAVNHVTLGIRNAIMAHLAANTDIQYVVLVGSDDIIPHHRTPDGTGIGNEREYLASSFLKPGSPLFFSVLQGYILTDDFYVDSFPMPWQGRALYVPDKAVSRLVETPDEIRAIAGAFIASNGTLDLSTALVTGYDFFDDGAGEVAAMLDAAGISHDDTLRLPNLWTAEDLRNLFLGVPHDIANINAHYTHYAILSAYGFETDNSDDVLTSTQAKAALANLLNTIIFTMGCHAGLNVPDASAFSAEDVGMGFDPQLDFVQAMHRAIYLASTGFGYGDDEGIGGTEQLMGIFLQQLLRNADGDSMADMTIGQALKAAKQRYITSLNTITAYEEKSSTQFTLYGLPQYQVQLPSGQFSGGSPSAQTASLNDGLNLNLTIIDGTNVETYSYPLEQMTTSSGIYFTADGDAQATPGRPVQPRVVIDLLGGDPVHGAMLVSGTYTEISPFDPVITRPTYEWEVGASEYQVDTQTYWPSELVTINNLETGGSVTQTMVLIPGQFRSVDQQTPVTGVQRLYTELTIKLLRSPLDESQPEDFNAPTIGSISLAAAGDTDVAVAVNASDASGIAQIVVLTIGNDSVTSTILDVSGLPQSGSFTVTVPFTGDERLVIQAVDGKGNVASATGKGASFSVIRVDAGPDLGFIPGIPVDFTASVIDFDKLVPPVFYSWDFGDGESATGHINSGSFTVPHTYDGSVLQTIATLKVTDANGGVGVDTVQVTIKTVPDVSVESSVNPSVVAQPVTFTANVRADMSLPWPLWIPTPAGGTVTFTENSTVLAVVPVTAGSDGVATATFTTSSLLPGENTITATYSGDDFFLPGTGNMLQLVHYNFVGFQSPIDGSQYNIGRTVPVKFSLTDFNGNSVGTATAQIKTKVNEGDVVPQGFAAYSDGYYQYNFNTSDLVGAVPGDLLTLIVSPDDRADHGITIQLK